MIDLHNLHIEGNLASVANPLNENRIEVKTKPTSKVMPEDNIINELEKMTLESKEDKKTGKREN